MVFGSLVELHAWLHSCLCFSLLEKLFLKASSTPPQHLLDTWLSVKLPSFFLSQSRQIVDSWWIDRESFWTLDSFSIDGGSIELLFLSLLYSSTPLRQLHLSTLFFSTPSSTDVSIPLDTSICRELLRIYIKDKRDPNFIFSRSLSLDTSVFSPPKSLSFTPNFFLKVSSSFSRFFFTW